MDSTTGSVATLPPPAFTAWRRARNCSTVLATLSARGLPAVVGVAAAVVTATTPGGAGVVVVVVTTTGGGPTLLDGVLCCSLRCSQ